MNFVGCRTVLEVRVGSHHAAEIVVHLRRKDLRRMSQRESMTEILNILEQSIIPRMFDEEVEVSLATLTKKKLPPALGPGGIPVEVGERNRQQRLQRKRKNAIPLKVAATPHQQFSDSSKKEKDIHYAFGERVQLAYRLQESKSSSSATLVVDDDGQYVRLVKLSKRILIWCYPFDPDRPAEEDIQLAGRQEMIPISHLFRQANCENALSTTGDLQL